MSEKETSLDKLESMYHEAETCDNDVFAEMRSNILIMSGQHYARTVGRGLSRNLRDAGVPKSKRIRLVKNHTQKAINDAKDIVASMVPGVMPYPAVDGETRHQKAAEVTRKIWTTCREQNKWDDFREKSIDNFFELGEVCSKIYFNPLKGGLRGFKQKVDEDGTPLYKNPLTGELTTDPSQENLLTGEIIHNEPIADETKPEFHGQVVIERFAPYDLLRDKAAKDINESPWLIYRKMISNDTLKSLIRQSTSMDDNEKNEAIEKIAEGKGTTYRVFNSGMGSFEEKEDHTLLKEIFFRQSPKYPKGYFVIWTEFGKIFEGPIPFGEHGEIAFPIKWDGHDRFESSARGFSPIKRVRPAQIEVNRCASAVSETQLLVGWDKVILNKGAKFERGVDQPGVRVFYSSGTPQVVQGRSGEQFMGYLEHNVNEIYRLVNIPENSNPTGQAFDPKAELFKMQRQKIRFTKPAGKLERYYKAVAETYLFLEQKYMNEERFTQLVGQTDAVDYEEYAGIERTDYSVRLEEVSGDLETMMGKTIELEIILQYAGKQLDEQTKVALLSQFPILNRHQAFKHILIHQKNIESDILQLERGQYVAPRRFDNHEMMLQFLTNRMASKDFGKLSEDIQGLFEAKYKAHEEELKKVSDEMREAQAGMIPTTGTLVRADVYVNDDPNDPTKTSRLEVPSDSLTWLKNRLEKQGLAQERLREIADLRTQANIIAGTNTPMPEQGGMNGY